MKFTKMHGNDYIYVNGFEERIENPAEFTIAYNDRHKGISADNKVEKVTVDMGVPGLEAAETPCAFAALPVVKQLASFGQYTHYELTYVSMGNPHAVIFTDDVLNLDLPKICPVIENSRYFSKRANTEFVEKLAGNRLRMRVWERGSGEIIA